MWAFGALVFEMLEGKTAYRGSSMEQLNMRIVRASHEAYSSQSPPAARALIKKTFEVEPLARLTAHDAARHPWFTELRRPQLDGADVIGAPQLGEGKTTGGAPAAVAVAERLGDDATEQLGGGFGIVGGRCVQDAKADGGRESIEEMAVA